jgi:hypothetical protein
MLRKAGNGKPEAERKIAGLFDCLIVADACRQQSSNLAIKQFSRFPSLYFSLKIRYSIHT